MTFAERLDCLVEPLRGHVLDTDVASALLRRRAPDSLARHLAGQVPAITFVTVGELTKWTLLRK